MKIILKYLILKILELKFRYCDKSSDSIKIAVVGGLNTKIYKEEIAESLRKHAITVLDNQSGYNYKLGLLLTLLKNKGGSSSYKFWLKNIFSKCNIIKEQVIVQEFVISKIDDIKWLINVYKFDVLVVTNDNNFSDLIYDSRNILKNKVLILPFKNESNNNVITYGEKGGNDLEIINIAENDKTDFQYRYEGVINSVQINKFGKHYVFACVIAKYIIKKIILKNK